MADTVEEVELRDHDRFDDHDYAGADDCEESGDVHESESVKDDIAWTSQ